MRIKILKKGQCVTWSDSLEKISNTHFRVSTQMYWLSEFPFINHLQKWLLNVDEYDSITISRFRDIFREDMKKWERGQLEKIDILKSEIHQLRYDCEVLRNAITILKTPIKQENKE